MSRKIVLVTGSEGMIGRELVEVLSHDKDIKIKKADLSLGDDLRYFKTCLSVTAHVDEVYNLVGIKGSPKKTSEKPADFFVPLLQFNTNMIEASRINNVKKFLYTSSIAVENLETDFYPATAKLAGEQQIETYRIQYGDKCKTKYCIVRPANVYGKYDDFLKNDKMVIASLIYKAFVNDVINVWGNGEQERDFINAKDVALGMIQCMNVMPTTPINLCSGVGIKIKDIAEIISKLTNKSIIYDTSQPTGALKRVMNFNGNLINWNTTININEGIESIINYLKEREYFDVKERKH